IKTGKLSGRITEPAAAHAAFTNSSKTLVLWGDGPVIHLWDGERKEESPKFDGHAYQVRSLSISADGKTALTASHDCIYVWDFPTGKKRLRMQSEDKEGFWCVGISPDGRTIASGGVDGSVRLWSMETGREVKKWKTPELGVFGVTWSPTGD